MNYSAVSSWNFLLNFLFHYCFEKNEVWKIFGFHLFQFVYTFPDQLVTDMSEPVLKG